MKKFKNLLLVLSVGLGLGMISGVAHTGGFTNEVRRVEAAAGEAISIGTGTNDSSAGTNTWNVDNVVTMVQRKGSSPTAPSSSYLTASGARFYIGNILEFTAIEGYSISKVEFKNSTTENYVGSKHKLGTSLSDNSVTNNKSLFNYKEGTTTGSLVTIEPISDATGSHFYFQIQNKQTRPQSFTITYKAVNTNASIETKFQDVTVQSMLSFSYKTTSTAVETVTAKANDSLKFTNGYGNEATEETYTNGRAKLDDTNLYYYDLTGFSGDITYSGSFYHNGGSEANHSTFTFVMLDANKSPIESTRVYDVVTAYVANSTSSAFSYTATLDSSVKYLGIDFTKTTGNIALDLSIAGTKLTPTYDYDNVKMSFKYEYDLSAETTVTDQGLVVSSEGTASFVQGTNAATFATSNTTRKYSKSLLAPNAPVGSYQVGVKISTYDETASEYDYTSCVMELYAAAYIVVDGKMYFSQVVNNGAGRSVSDLLDVYIADIDGANKYTLGEYEDVIKGFADKLTK